MVYVDYEFYVTDYLGRLSRDEFYRVVIKASAHIRRITFGCADYHVKDEAVKLATCAVCDVIAEDEKRRRAHNGFSVISENIDGYSVSYVNEQASGESTEKILAKKIYSAAEVYLMPTGLLNWGCI